MSNSPTGQLSEMPSHRSWNREENLPLVRSKVSIVQAESPSEFFTSNYQHSPNPQYINPLKPRPRRGIDADALYELPEDDLHLASSFCDRNYSSARSMKSLPRSDVQNLDTLASQNHATYSGGSGAKRHKSAVDGTFKSTTPLCDSFLVDQCTVESPLDTGPGKVDPRTLESVVEGTLERTTKRRVNSSSKSSKSKNTGRFQAPNITKPSARKWNKPVQMVASSNPRSKSSGWTTTEDTLKYSAKSFAIAKTTLDKLSAFRFEGTCNGASFFKPLRSETMDTAGNLKQSHMPTMVLYQPQAQFSHVLSGSNNLLGVANPKNCSSSQVENLTCPTQLLKNQSLLVDNHSVFTRNTSDEPPWKNDEGGHFVSTSPSTRNCPISALAGEGTLIYEIEPAQCPQYAVSVDAEAISIPQVSCSGAAPSQKLVLWDDVLSVEAHDAVSIASQSNIGRSSSSELIESNQIPLVNEACMQEQGVSASVLLKGGEIRFDKDKSAEIQRDQSEIHCDGKLTKSSDSCDVSFRRPQVHRISMTGNDAAPTQLEVYESSSESENRRRDLRSKLDEPGSEEFEIEAYDDEGVTDSDLLGLVQDDLVAKTKSPAASDSIANSRTRIILESPSRSFTLYLSPRDIESNSEDEYAMDAEDEEELLNFPESPSLHNPTTIRSAGANDGAVRTSPQTPNSLIASPKSLMLANCFSHIDKSEVFSTPLWSQTSAGGHMVDQSSLYLIENHVSHRWQDTVFTASDSLGGNTASEIDAKLEIYSRRRLQGPECCTLTNGPPLHAQSTITRPSDDVLYTALPRFARPNFPALVRDQSPVIGLSSQCFIRTCFRIGEMYREGKRCTSFNKDAIIELFARVTHSTRETSTAVQHFKFADLWSDKPPFLDGVLMTCKLTGLASVESIVFIDMEGPKMARCLGRLKTDSKNASGWVLHIANIRETDWEEIRYTRKIVSAGSVTA